MTSLSDSSPDWDAVKVWRKAQRAELVARRESVAAAQRSAWNSALTEHLLAGFGVPGETVVGLCWPYKGEFDARFAMRRWREHGAIAALPEVVVPKAPLQFRKWWPGAPMRPGVYDIPVPSGTEVLTPDIAVVPMNAFDGRGFRLGYGGGFFDRTLAAAGGRMVAIGVSYEMLRLDTIHPQPHDIPMDFVVTEAGVYAAGGKPLARIDAAQSRARFAQLMTERRLPRETYRSEGYSSPVCYAADFPEYFRGPDEKP